jgi:GNAT superfamily N-acetyltransferase
MEDVSFRPANSREEVRETTTVAGAAFSSYDPEWFQGRVLNVPALPRENTIIGIQNGEIVTSLQLYERQWLINGRPLWGAAIGNVATLPEHQGRGYGSQMLEESITFIEEKGYAFSIVHGDPALYSRFGWTPVPFSDSDIIDPVPAEGGKIENISSIDQTDDIEDLDTIHRRSRTDQAAAMLRPKTIWRDWILEPETSILSDYTISKFQESGSTTGFMVWTTRDDLAHCVETTYCGNSPGTFYRSCWEFLRQRGQDTLRWRPPNTTVLPFSKENASVDVDTTILASVHDSGVFQAVTGGAVSRTDELVDFVCNDDWYWSPIDNF